MMKAIKWMGGVLLLLLGAALTFVGAAGSWESLTSSQPVGLILMLPMAAIGAGLIWLGVRLLRGRSAKKAQVHVPSEQEKADQEKESRIRDAQEEARRKALKEAQERVRQEHVRWLEEHPEWKAQFDYLYTMLSREALSFYDPSGMESGGMSDSRNHTGGEWMRTLPVYDLERVIEFYQTLWDTRDHVSREDLLHAPYSLLRSLDALSYRRLYLRLNNERQLTALGDRKEALLERCREADIHLVLQLSSNEILDMTDGMVYTLHVKEMGQSPLADEPVGGEVTLVPVEKPASPQEQGPKARREAGPSMKRTRELMEKLRTQSPENKALIARLERVTEAFSCQFIRGVYHPSYIEGKEVDELEGVQNCFVIAPNADLDQMIDIWLDLRAVKAESLLGENFYDQLVYDCDRGRATFLIEDEAQLVRSTNGKEALMLRCREHNISLMLDLGDGYYQRLDSRGFFALEVGETWTGNGDDDATTYGRLEWERVPPLPPRPSQP